jgi:excisionase family DNA binding protein
MPYIRRVPREDLTLMSLSQAQALLGAGNSTFWALIDSGGLRTVQVGQRRKVLRTDLEAYLASLPEAPPRRKRAR